MKERRASKISKLVGSIARQFLSAPHGQAFALTLISTSRPATSFGLPVLYVDSGGPLPRDLRTLPFRRIERPKWPFDEQPFAQPNV